MTWLLISENALSRTLALRLLLHHSQWRIQISLILTRAKKTEIHDCRTKNHNSLTQKLSVGGWKNDWGCIECLAALKREKLSPLSTKDRTRTAQYY